MEKIKKWAIINPEYQTYRIYDDLDLVSEIVGYPSKRVQAKRLEVDFDGLYVRAIKTCYDITNTETNKKKRVFNLNQVVNLTNAKFTDVWGMEMKQKVIVGKYEIYKHLGIEAGIL